MSKILPATCQANVVTIESHVIAPSGILSEGVKASEGLALIEKDSVTYITSNASDIKDLITNIGDVLTKITTALTGIDAVTTTPGSNAALITLITTAKTALVLQKDNLK